MTVRPTLRQMANGNAVDQWQCTRCGSRQWWVRNSYFVESDGSRHRKRECRQCHATLYTREVAICSNDDDQSEMQLDE